MTAATYDGDGLRASSTTSSGGTQNYAWNTQAGTPQLIMDGASAYIYGPSATPDEQVSLATGAVTYPVTDSLGSVRGTSTLPAPSPVRRPTTPGATRWPVAG